MGEIYQNFPLKTNSWYLGNILFDYFYKRLGSKNKSISDQIFLGGLSQHSYAIETQLLDNQTRPSDKIEKSHILGTLLT